ncbi:MAG: CPBP family intramembrane metalloprotease [Pirellulales bacterium]|nr:CPBP family intramembrane metalloprotease [Pirellulales bacterium]
MPLTPETILIALGGLFLFAGSVACCIWAIHTLATKGQLLASAYRRPVPWSGPATFLIVLSSFVVSFAPAVMVLFPEQTSLFSPDVSTTQDPLDGAAETEVATNELMAPEQFSSFLLWDSAFKVMFTVVTGTVLMLGLKATTADLGLTARFFDRDVITGVLTFGIILIPIGALNVVLSLIVDPKSEHPILDMLKNADTPWHVWGTSILAAVIIAPLVEEFLFRGIFQGYLERRFGQQSWLPIVISSVFFATVHFNGDSPAPIPLFFFALGLGYLYRQTHRLWPCIVLHFCLNALSISVMWLVSRNPDFPQ